MDPVGLNPELQRKFAVYLFQPVDIIIVLRVIQITKTESDRQL